MPCLSRGTRAAHVEPLLATAHAVEAMRGATKDKGMNHCDHNEALHPTRMDIPTEIRR